MTEKVTGNAQTSACVDVLPRCSPDHKTMICLLFYRKFQPPTQTCWRYPNDQRKLGTDKLDRWRHIRNRRGRLETRLRKFITCLLQRSEVWKQDQFKHLKLLRYLRNCSECKMLLETKNVARRNKRSCQKHNTLTTGNTFAFSSTLRPGYIFSSGAKAWVLGGGFQK